MPTAPEASWIRQHLITYADDLIAKWTFASKAQVHQMVLEIGVLLDVLQDAGMEVDLAKTAFLWRLNGYQAKSIRKQFLVKRDSKVWLRVPTSNAAGTFIPVKQTHQYLGVIASFYAFEDQTPWLLKRHSFPLSLRLSLWTTCVAHRL